MDLQPCQHGKKIVVNKVVSFIASLQVMSLEEYYKFVRPKVALATNWVEKLSKAKYYPNDVRKWWM